MGGRLANDTPSGVRFGRLRVAGDRFVFVNGRQRHRAVVCACDCGAFTVARCSSLRAGKTLSCGCLHSEVISTSGIKHGGYGTKLHRIWQGMKRRCLSSTGDAFQKYASQGIRFCPEWDSFEGFRSWAIESGYRDGFTLDRRDSNGNYEPGNCRWATPVHQMQNRRKARRPKTSYGSTSRYKGVSWNAQIGRWVAQIKTPVKHFHLGLYDDEQAAAEAYDSAAREHFGEFACVNFPLPGESPALPVEVACAGLAQPRRVEQ